MPNEKPEELCERLARLKAKAVNNNIKIKNIKNSLVIAADTIVVIDNKILGKPKNFNDAIEMLELLQGREHEVLTGIALCFGNKIISGFEKTRVIFRPLNHEQIKAYAQSGEGLDKAGAYAIQGKGALLISGIHGDYFNVVGLPLCKLGLMLEN